MIVWTSLRVRESRKMETVTVTHLVLLLPLVALLLQTCDLTLKVFRLDIDLSQPTDDILAKHIEVTTCTRTCP